MAKVSPSGSSCYHPIRFHISLQVDSLALKIFLKKLYALFFPPEFYNMTPPACTLNSGTVALTRRVPWGEASEGTFAIFPLVPTKVLK